jgi:hypothetical protein
MARYDVNAFVRELDRLGLRLSTFRHLDGAVRLYRWRLMNYPQNEQAIQRLWNEHIGEDERKIAQLAETLENQGTRERSSSAA